MEVCNCYKCDGKVKVWPQEGGFRGEMTMYFAECETCGMIEEYLGTKDGRKKTAIKEYNAIFGRKK